MYTPIRTCIVTREKRPKNELIRITRVKEDINIDINQNMPGRGVYIIPELKTFEEALTKKKIEYGLKLKRKLGNNEIERLRKDFEAVLRK